MEHTTAADAYGESFADVYDEWYPSEARAAAVAAALGRRRPGGDRSVGDGAGRCRGRVLELGVGTGVLALALARDGWEVVGVDSSPSMLAALEAKGPPVRITWLTGDAGEPSTWPAGPFDVVLAAWNLLTNLVDRDAQRSLLRGASDVLCPDGRLVIEAFVPLPPTRRERRVAPGSVTIPGSLVRVHTDADPATGVIEGRHVELRDGAVVVRPWRLCWLGVDELDAMARRSGFELVERTESWEGAEFAADQSPGHVSWYRLRPA